MYLCVSVCVCVCVYVCVYVCVCVFRVCGDMCPYPHSPPTRPFVYYRRRLRGKKARVLINTRLNGLNGTAPTAPLVAHTKTKDTKDTAIRKRKFATPPPAPCDFDTKPLISSCLIQARTGSVRSYICGRIQTTEADYLFVYKQDIITYFFWGEPLGSAMALSSGGVHNANVGDRCMGPSKLKLVVYTTQKKSTHYAKICKEVKKQSNLCRSVRMQRRS